MKFCSAATTDVLAPFHLTSDHFVLNKHSVLVNLTHSAKSSTEERKNRRLLLICWPEKTRVGASPSAARIIFHKHLYTNLH